MIVLSRRQPQRKRRQRRFDPLKAAGYDNRPHKQHWWLALLHNKWITYGGLGLIALSMVGGTFISLSGNTGRTQNASDVRLFDTATPQPSPTGTPDPNATPTPIPSPTPTPIPRRFASAPEMQIDPEKQYFATIKTEKGDIRVQLLPREAPQAVNNFVFLARNDYYDGLTFHRVIPGFVAQGGDAGSGTPGYAIPSEQSTLSHEPGTIAFARNNATGQLTAQFYISLRPQPTLDGRDTVFGRIVSGQDVIGQLVERNPERVPNAPPGDKIENVLIEEGPVG